MGERLVVLEREGSIACLTLNRPSARNALSVALCRALIESLERVSEMVSREEARVAILRGAGSSFCAGADLKERSQMDATAMSDHSALIARCGDELANLSCPVIACIHGGALGGGLELALACDLRVVAENAVLGFPEVSFGFFPGAGGPVRLARLVGMSTATYLLMSGRRITGEQSVELNIAHVAAPLQNVEEAAAQLATEIAGYPPAGIRALRELLSSLDEKRTRGGMRRARKLRDALNSNPEVQQSMESFGQHA